MERLIAEIPLCYHISYVLHLAPCIIIMPLHHRHHHHSTKKI